MSCYTPIHVAIDKKSIVTDRKIRYTQQVGCGHCLGCRYEQSRHWAVRILHEEQMHKRASFVTLTYSDFNVPRNGTLVPAHLSTFIKNLRHEVDDRISFFGAGEYGDINRRPHYHLAIFGPPFEKRFQRQDLYYSPTIEDVWGKGRTDIGPITPASAAYVAGYVMKKQLARDNHNHLVRVNPLTGELFEVAPEFSRMSLNPALGRTWIQRYWRDVYPRDAIVVQGKEYKPPRYYDKWMDDNLPLIMDYVRDVRFENMEDLDPYTLDAMHEAHRARHDLFTRRDL